MVRKYSIDIEADLTQLLSVMLYNPAINNTDDHERNFSLISAEDGYRLSPGYDLVPSLTTGTYPVAGYQYSPWAPKASEVAKHGKIFGLPKTKVKIIAEQVITAVEQWPDWAQKNNVPEKDYENIRRVIVI